MPKTVGQVEGAKYPVSNGQGQQSQPAAGEDGNQESHTVRKAATLVTALATFAGAVGLRHYGKRTLMKNITKSLEGYPEGQLAKVPNAIKKALTGSTNPDPEQVVQEGKHCLRFGELHQLGDDGNRIPQQQPGFARGYVVGPDGNLVESRGLTGGQQNMSPRPLVLASGWMFKRKGLALQRDICTKHTIGRHVDVTFNNEGKPVSVDPGAFGFFAAAWRAINPFKQVSRSDDKPYTFDDFLNGLTVPT